MNNYQELRKVRTAMSEAVNHDIRALIAKINERRPQAVTRIIDPGTEAEQCHATARPTRSLPNNEYQTAS